MSESNCCEHCVNYVYDSEYEYYECEVNLDEDDLVRFLSNSRESCPYFRADDEYKVVRKQM